MKKHRTTVATVNRILKDEKFPCRLVRGDGYYYFYLAEDLSEDERVKIRYQVPESIYTYSISDDDPQEYVDEAKQFYERLKNDK